jgi:hypothetical protein
MATTTRAAPPSCPASFRDLDDRAVGIAEQRWCNPGVGGGRQTKSQCGAKKDRPHHARFSVR